MLLFLTASVMAIASVLSGCKQPRTAATVLAGDRPVPTVRVVKARKMDVPIIGRPNGTTVALNQVTIRARVRGFLKEKHFVEGSNVKAGQLLLVIDEEPFKADLNQAQAKLDAARADLEKASSSKSREVAAAQVDVSQATLDLALVEEKRETNLLARAATSRENVDRIVAARKRNEAEVKADQARLQQTRADYDSNLLIAKANVEKAQADLDVARINLGYCRMFAPIDGRIGELQVKLGNLVGPGTGSAETTSLVSIQQLDPLGVEIRPASRFLPLLTRLVRTGPEARQTSLKVNLAVQGQKPHPYTGWIDFIDNAVDPTTSTVLVRGEIPNPEQTLLPGEYVRADLNVGDYTGAIVIPEQALVEGQEGFRVLVVDAQKKIQAVIVKPLDTYQGLEVLESGLNEGQDVVVEGIQLARPGMTVQTEEVELEQYQRATPEAEVSDPLSSPMIKIRATQPAPAEKTPAETKSRPEPASGG